LSNTLTKTYLAFVTIFPYRIYYKWHHRRKTNVYSKREAIYIIHQSKRMEDCSNYNTKLAQLKVKNNIKIVTKIPGLAKRLSHNWRKSLTCALYYCRL
jgi:hypothetical protein